MKNRNLTKKILKYRLQKDWMTALIITAVFLALYWFDEIDWSWHWLVSPIWILAGVYFVCVVFALIFGYFINKKIKTIEKWESMGKSRCGKYCISPKDCECFKSLKK